MSLRDYIADRRVALKAQIQQLRAELRELDIAEAALSSETGEAEPSQSAPTIKGMVTVVLKTGPADAHEIVGEIKKNFGVEVARSSLSPQLSRLKAEGVVQLDGTKWSLVPKRPTPTIFDDVDVLA